MIFRTFHFDGKIATRPMTAFFANIERFSLDQLFLPSFISTVHFTKVWYSKIVKRSTVPTLSGNIESFWNRVYIESADWFTITLS